MSAHDRPDNKALVRAALALRHAALELRRLPSKEHQLPVEQLESVSDWLDDIRLGFRHE